MYDDAISSVDIIPVIGKNIRGIKEVAAKGSASVIHNIAIKTAIAAIVFTCGLVGSKSPTNSRMINAATPNTNPNFLVVCIIC
jgi:hypothetical protein